MIREGAAEHDGDEGADGADYDDREKVVDGFERLAVDVCNRFRDLVDELRELQGRNDRLTAEMADMHREMKKIKAERQREERTQNMNDQQETDKNQWGADEGR